MARPKPAKDFAQNNLKKPETNWYEKAVACRRPVHFCLRRLGGRPFYAGGNVAFWNYDEGSQDVKFNVSSVEGVVGFNVWEMINIEGRLGIGMEGSTETVTNKQDGTLPTKLTLDNYASVYVKPELKMKSLLLWFVRLHQRKRLHRKC